MRPKGQPMPNQEYAVRQVDGIWQVRLDGRLIGGRSTQIEALNLAECLAQRAAATGKSSKVLVPDSADGIARTFPAFRWTDRA